MKLIAPEGFIVPNSVTKPIGEYAWRISVSGIDGTSVREFAVFFTDEPWDSVTAFAEGLLGESYDETDGIKIRSIDVLGDPEHAPEEVCEKFIANSPPKEPGKHFSFSQPLF